MLDVTNWTALLVALSTLLIAALRRKDMSDTAVALLTVGVTAICFFAGRALDGALAWPVSQSLAAELFAALVANQTLYALLRKTPMMQKLETSGPPHPGSGVGILALIIIIIALYAIPVAAAVQTITISPGDTLAARCSTTLSVAQVSGGVDLTCAATQTTATPTRSATATPTKPPATPTATAAATPTSAPASTGGHPAGCAAGELFVDSQDWWMRAPNTNGKEFGHLHTSLCWPYRGTLSSTRQIKVISKLHNNPGEFRRLDVQVFDAAINPCNGDSYAIDCHLFNPPRTLAQCTATGGTLSDGGATCAWTDYLTLNPSRISKSGWLEFRFRGFVREPDGSEMRTSTGLQLNVQNGKPVWNYRTQGPDFTETRGWYTDAQYAVARSLDYGRIVAGPISGVWSPRVAMKAGSGGVTVTSHYAALDTDFHHNNAGVPIKQGSGPYEGTITIDTTKLANGWHRLCLKTDQLLSSKGSINSSVFITWFYVQN